MARLLALTWVAKLAAMHAQAHIPKPTHIMGVRYPGNRATILIEKGVPRYASPPESVPIMDMALLP
jgi:hypothetical protein